MNIYKFTFGLFLVMTSQFVFAQNNGELPPNAEEGKCYAKSKKAYQYQTIKKKVVVKDAYVQEEFIPAVYDTIVDRVLIRDAYTKIVAIPAQLDTTTQEVKVKNESHVMIEEYKTFERKKVVAPASGQWEETDDVYCNSPTGDCKTMKWVETDPTYETLREEALVSVTKGETTEAEYEEMERIKLIQDGNYKREFVPAEYRDVKKVITVSTAKRKQLSIPVEYKTIEVKELVQESEGEEWVEIVCPDEMNAIVISQIQLALKLRDYYKGDITGAYDDETKEALAAYQKNEGLPIGNMDTATMMALGFNAKAFEKPMMASGQKTKKP